MVLPLRMWYFEVNASQGSHHFISISDTYESMMGGNPDIKEDRERNIIYLGKCVCVKGEKKLPDVVRENWNDSERGETRDGLKQIGI